MPVVFQRVKKAPTVKMYDNTIAAIKCLPLGLTALVTSVVFKPRKLSFLWIYFEKIVDFALKKW